MPRYSGFLIKMLTGLLMSWPVIAASVISLQEGEAIPVSSGQEIDTVFIANPDVADYQVIDRHKIVVYGKATGKTSLIAFNENHQAVINRKLVVNRDFSEVIQQIQRRFPRSSVELSNIGKQIVLSGTVSSHAEKDGIYELAGQLLGRDASTQTFQLTSEEGEQQSSAAFMTRRVYQGIINQIEVAQTKQVNVKLSVAEVSQQFMENFGIQFGDSGQTAGVFANPILNFSADDLLTTITAINDDSVGQVLAEPNLSVISGESASFLVGGEIPVVTVIDGSVSVQYKEYGVRLEMLAKVLRDDKIKLSLQPEVSSLDTQYSNENYDLPALKTRRVKTSIELRNGQSFVLGGLLSTEDVESLKKIPYVGDIPLLGALFRHTETSRNKTELIIVATVNLVQPVSPYQIQLPAMQRTSNLSRFFGFRDKYTPAVTNETRRILATGGFRK
ncbi:type II and III secretion system protein family protein [Vibrio aerogenes]|uniref:type II and III secretion system protein family protein n=1 Tax=Vibrio aerogenes TaxID=92172 RepID=UPI000935EA51